MSRNIANQEERRRPQLETSLARNSAICDLAKASLNRNRHPYSIVVWENTYQPTDAKGKTSMKNHTIIAVVISLVLLPTLRAAPSGECATAVIEQYGTGGSTPLKWRAFVPNDRLQHPAIVVIHG